MQQPSVYTDSSYGQGMTYANGGYAQVGGYSTGSYVPGATNNYAGSYGNTQVHANGSVVDLYGRTPAQTSGTVIDLYGRPQVQTNSATDATNPYGVGNATVSYDTTVAVSSVPSAFDLSRSVGAGTTFDHAKAGAGGGVTTYDALRGNPVSNAAAQYDPTRTSVNVPGSYDSARGNLNNNPGQIDPSKAAGMNGPGAYAAYDAMQR